MIEVLVLLQCIVEWIVVKRGLYDKICCIVDMLTEKAGEFIFRSAVKMFGKVGVMKFFVDKGFGFDGHPEDPSGQEGTQPIGARSGTSSTSPLGQEAQEVRAEGLEAQPLEGSTSPSGQEERAPALLKKIWEAKLELNFIVLW